MSVNLIQCSMALAIIPQIYLEKNYIELITIKVMKSWAFDFGYRDDLYKGKRRSERLDQHSPICFAVCALNAQWS